MLYVPGAEKQRQACSPFASLSMHILSMHILTMTLEFELWCQPVLSLPHHQVTCMYCQETTVLIFTSQARYKRAGCPGADKCRATARRCHCCPLSQGACSRPHINKTVLLFPFYSRQITTLNSLRKKLWLCQSWSSQVSSETFQRGPPGHARTTFVPQGKQMPRTA